MYLYHITNYLIKTIIISFFCYFSWKTDVVPKIDPRCTFEGGCKKGGKRNGGKDLNADGVCEYRCSKPFPAHNGARFCGVGPDYDEGDSFDCKPARGNSTQIFYVLWICVILLILIKCHLYYCIIHLMWHLVPNFVMFYLVNKGLVEAMAPKHSHPISAARSIPGKILWRKQY